MKKPVLFLILISLLVSCDLKDKGKAKTKAYFDMEGYFKQEALRLSESNPSVNKTVFVNGKEELKNIKIKNWEQEFKSFIDADINKASWKGSFTMVNIDDLKTYVSNNNKIPVKKLEVTSKNNKITSIKVYITNANDLYTSLDSLSYFPDSIYQIKKTQHIKLMNLKQYNITGKFK